VAIDPLDAVEHHAAEISLHGPLEEPATWQALRERLRDEGVGPRAFIHAMSGFAGPDSPGASGQKSQDPAFCDLIDGAMLGCEHVMPLMTDGDASVVFLGSDLAGWDTHAGTGPYSATQAGLLALMRSLTLSAGPRGIRVNAVATGLVADDQDGQALPPEVRGRIPLGRAANPDDIVNAIMFLLSEDASLLVGNLVLVDGGTDAILNSRPPRSNELTRFPGS